MRFMFFFGYGSLVNADTHDHGPVYPARVRGWRRAWVATPDRALCYLTALPDPESEIEGLIAPVPGGDWRALDSREAAYERHDGIEDVVHAAPAQRIAIYAIAPSRHGAPGPENPILLSYLDTVIAGFRTVYGPEGAARFFATTSGWQAPVLNDRATPRYRRATRPDAETLETVDAALSAQDSRIISAD